MNIKTFIGLKKLKLQCALVPALGWPHFERASSSSVWTSVESVLVTCVVGFRLFLLRIYSFFTDLHDIQLQLIRYVENSP